MWRRYRDKKRYSLPYQYVPNLYLVVWGEPLSGTVFLDTASASCQTFLHLLTGEGGWGRGRHIESHFPRKKSFQIFWGEPQ